jgi:heme exporter protein A
MKTFELFGKNLGMSFVRRKNVFSDIDISLINSEIIGIAGTNGSGKTTLLKILLGILRPTRGKLTFSIEGQNIKWDDIASHIGFVSSYLTLYEEFTPIEHLHLFAKFKEIKFNRKNTAKILKEFDLYKRQNDLIKTFSSGMKQRVKYMIAMQSQPEIFFLDEPFTNLDNTGIESVKKVIQNHLSNGGGVIIASNDEREKELCSRFTYLNY